MRKLTPIDTKGDGWLIVESLNEMYVRMIQLSRKRPSPIDLEIPTASIRLVVALEDYFSGEKTAEEVVELIGKIGSFRKYSAAVMRLPNETQKASKRPAQNEG